ncbi:LPS O-antigen chain length determinant protein WzzB [Pseudomonas sp.]|uniref:LPS O-antigen chain length determinant protein WzzB n=1 Tax=Pseudomonas sp. TaxID=306 RepID=UPI0027319A0C|nr:LPS O-antigen chain length determinant protein WzzB [Pseudomonas sp.]MDP2245002.1 LPS O-antigen chain length determinant protein WzzB [Pseudomonas sp.]
MTEQTYPRQANNDDEIDLLELFHGLWTQKWLIVLVTLIFAVGAASYAFLSRPVYEARAAVLSPSLSDIAGFNLGRTGEGAGGNGLKPFSVSDVYAVFTRNLQSERSKRQFFRQVYLPSLDETQRAGSQDGIYKEFNKEFSVKVLDKNQPDRFTIVVEHYSPELASTWTKHYIDQVAERSLAEMLQNSERELAVQARNIEQQIKSERASAKARRDDRTKQLQEALTVAEAIGLNNPPVITGRVSNDSELSAFMDGSLMYMRGAKALYAEMQVLLARTSDDPFIPELRNLEGLYQLLAGVSLDPSSVAVFRQDGEIEVPDQPIKPKKPLIVALGVVLGGMLGVFIALIRLMLRKRAAKAL